MKSNIGFGFILVMLFTLFVFAFSGQSWLGLGVVLVVSFVAVLLANNGWQIGKDRRFSSTPSKKAISGLTARGDLWDLLVPIGFIIGLWGPLDGFVDNFFGLIIFQLGLFFWAHKLWKQKKVTFLAFLFAFGIFVWFLSFDYRAHILSEGSDIPTIVKDTLLISHGTEYYVTAIEATAAKLLRFSAYVTISLSILGNEIILQIIKRRHEKV